MENLVTFALLKAVGALLWIGLLLVGATALALRQRRLSAFLQLAGVSALVLVALFHIFEALNLFPAMGWGREDSIGHYLDLAMAMLGGILFPVGYVLHAMGLTSGTRGSPAPTATERG